MEAGDQRENVALVTKTLVHNAASVLSDPGRLTWPKFLDFSSLCEACVILDRLQAIESADVLPDFVLTQELRDAKLLSEFRPSVSRRDLQRVIMRLPEEITRRIAPTFWEAGGEGFNSAATDLRPEDALSPTGALAGIDYDRGISALLSQVEEAVKYPSLEAAGHSERALRSNGYLLVAAANGLDYFPDFDRAPFVLATIKALYRSLPVQVYRRVADEFAGESDSTDDVIAELTVSLELPIPPATALVLGRSLTLADVPRRLLEVREEFAEYRHYFRAFKARLQSAATLEERRKLRRHYGELLQLASGPESEIISASEVLNLAEKTVQVAAAPLVPTSYSADLIRQPAEWIRRWWMRRPLAVLFRLDGKLAKLGEYRDAVERLWGAEVQDDLLAQFAEHSTKVKLLMGRSDSSSPPDRRL